MNNYPFVKCLDPQQIYNKYLNEWLIVGCGKCEACLMQKSSMRALKCKLESQCHKHTLFITLTYANQYIPRMMPFCVNDAANRLKEKRHYYFYDVTNRGVEGQILAEADYSFSELASLQNKCNLGEALPYLCVEDLQKFMKRLRKYISYYTDEKIRYYAVGEYGPVHFRPHFHIMLWFSSEQTYEAIQENLCKAWPFGRVDIQESQGKCASYVAGYVNGSCNLPRVFTSGKTKPFQVHSRFLGEKFLRHSKEEIYKSSVKSVVHQRANLDGLNTEFTIWRSLKTAYFPRCPRYATLSHEQRLQSYLSYAAASEVCRETSPFRQAIEIVDNVISGNYSSDNVLYSYFIKNYVLHPFLGLTAYNRKVRQVYMELRTSEHFLNFVCDGITDLRHVDASLRMIESFYNQCEILNLGEQILSIDEFIKYDACELDDLVYLYNNKFFSSESFKNRPIYRKFKEKQLNKALHSVKHKTLNDQNKIFCF